MITIKLDKLISLGLMLAGLAGALAGGWLIGRWCMGLVLVLESAGLMWLGLMREESGKRERGQQLAAGDWRGWSDSRVDEFAGS